MKDLGIPHYFLGVEAQHFEGGLFLHQAKYAAELLERAQMSGCKPISTPMVSTLHLLTLISIDLLLVVFST